MRVKIPWPIATKGVKSPSLFAWSKKCCCWWPSPVPLTCVPVGMHTCLFWLWLLAKACNIQHTFLQLGLCSKQSLMETYRGPRTKKFVYPPLHNYFFNLHKHSKLCMCSNIKRSLSQFFKLQNSGRDHWRWIFLYQIESTFCFLFGLSSWCPCISLFCGLVHPAEVPGDVWDSRNTMVSKTDSPGTCLHVAWILPVRSKAVNTHIREWEMLERGIKLDPGSQPVVWEGNEAGGRVGNQWRSYGWGINGSWMPCLFRFGSQCCSDQPPLGATIS